jgi:chitinase
MTTLQMRIAISGWTINNPQTIQMTWSGLVSTAASRVAFIGSLLRIMETYGFNGVDVRWE